MSGISHSYVLSVLLAPRSLAGVSGGVARRWHRMFDPYRPELYYMRGPGPKWRERRARDIACAPASSIAPGSAAPP